jgi:ribosomal protein S18 acetylase RimI-like enzyme
MIALPEAALLPLVDQISFRPEQAGDEGFLYQLYASTRAGEMALTGWGVTQQEAFLRMQFQFQTTHYRKHYGDALFQVILRDNAPIGRIYLHYGPSQIRLMDIALMPEHRCSGIGGSILENLLREAAQLGKPVTLHVERFNPALRLYERLGFRVVEDLGINLYMEWLPPTA